MTRLTIGRMMRPKTLTSLLLCLVLLLAAGLAWAKPKKDDKTDDAKSESEPKKDDSKKDDSKKDDSKKDDSKKDADEEPKKKDDKDKADDDAPRKEAPKKEAPRTGAAEEEQPSITATIPCSACHTTAGWKAKGADGTGEGAGGFDHSKTGFPLTGEHAKTACVSCHNGKTAIKRACISCHADSHRARLGEVCERCHTPSGWRNTRSLDMHRLTRFPLTGMHVLRDCTECHRRASEHQWTGVPIDCFACHEKDYRRTDLRPVHNGSVAGQNAFPRDCSLCHRSIAWAPARFDSALITDSSSIPLKTAAPATHDVKFPIRFGVHRTATCDDCHTNTATPRAVRCTGCHAHEPVRLAAQHKATVSPLATGCLSCHPGGIRR